MDLTTSSSCPTPALADLLQRPFKALIEVAQPIFTDRVTRSRTGAISPSENPNSDNFFSDNLEAQDAETRFSFAIMARLLEIMSANIQQPPPLVSQPKTTVGSVPRPKVSTPKASSILSVPMWPC